MKGFNQNSSTSTKSANNTASIQHKLLNSCTVTGLLCSRPLRQGTMGGNVHTLPHPHKGQKIIPLLLRSLHCHECTCSGYCGEEQDSARGGTMQGARHTIIHANRHSVVVAQRGISAQHPIATWLTRDHPEHHPPQGSYIHRAKTADLESNPAFYSGKCSLFSLIV